jgi:hypothetical protein
MIPRSCSPTRQSRCRLHRSKPHLTIPAATPAAYLSLPDSGRQPAVAVLSPARSGIVELHGPIAAPGGSDDPTRDQGRDRARSCGGTRAKGARGCSSCLSTIESCSTGYAGSRPGLNGDSRGRLKHWRGERHLSPSRAASADPSGVPDDARLEARRIVEDLEACLNVDVVGHAFAHRFDAQPQDLCLRLCAADQADVSSRLNGPQSGGFQRRGQGHRHS